MQIYTLESVSKFLENAGIKNTPKRRILAPQLTSYFLDYKDIKDINKLSKAVKMLEAATGQNIHTTKSREAQIILQIPNEERQIINTLKAGKYLLTAKPSSVLFGLDIFNEWKSETLAELPHLLVAGTTGSGKSVALNNIILSLACYNTPQDLELVLIDLKKFEFQHLKRLPHLALDIITDKDQAETTLTALVDLMEERAARKEKDQNITFKNIAVVIDELSDLVLQNKKVKNLLVRLLQKSRALQIYFIVATQTPRATVLDGQMLANLPSRLALTCSSTRESVLILGHKGAETLTGKGDAILKLANTTEEKRIQIPLLTKQQAQRLII